MFGLLIVSNLFAQSDEMPCKRIDEEEEENWLVVIIVALRLFVPLTFGMSNYIITLFYFNSIQNRSHSHQCLFII